MRHKKIVIFQCGGTIDKLYPQTAGSYAFLIGKPAAKRILERIRPAFQYEIKTLMRKDSLDMTDDDRTKVFEACAKETSEIIIITHGTDTMTVTAQVLSKIKGKTIVLVGSSLPEQYQGSDADFSFCFAIGASLHAPHGVYIAMNGTLFRWNQVAKQQNG